MIWQGLKTALGQTFWNTGLAQIITIFVGGYFLMQGYFTFQQWSAERKASAHISAVEDRCESDERSKLNIDKEVQDAIASDVNNDFINQRVRD